MERRWRRRTVLAALAGTAVAGCLDGSDGSGTAPETSPERSERSTTEDTTTRTAEPTTAVPTPNSDACPDEPRVPPTMVDPADLPSIPDRPATLEPDPVRSYVEDYEYAYKYREMAGYGQGIVEFNLEVNATAESVAPNAVLVAAGYAMDHGRWDDGDGTPHGYFDGHRYSFAYLVTDAAVWRATRRETNNPPDPREDGLVLECF